MYKRPRYSDLRGGAAPDARYLDTPDNYRALYGAPGEGAGGPAGAGAGPAYLYVNATVTNATAAPLAPTSAVVNYVENRAAPVVNNAADYLLSIVRWDAVGLDLPLFIPEADTTQADPKQTVYVLRGDFSPVASGWLPPGDSTPASLSLAVAAPVVWVPQQTDAPRPARAR